MVKNQRHGDLHLWQEDYVAHGVKRNPKETGIEASTLDFDSQPVPTDRDAGWVLGSETVQDASAR